MVLVNGVIGLIPAAGKGTRVAHLTNGGSKEMLIYAGKPLIAHAIAELKAAGVKEIIVVSHPTKKDLNQYLFNQEDVTTLYQFLQQGLGDAIRSARPLRSGPFVVLLPDVVDLAYEATKDLLSHNKFGLITQNVSPTLVHNYGVVEAYPDGRISRLIEKPEEGETTSTQAIMGRYYLPPAIVDLLSRQKATKNNEVQLTDALRAYTEIYRLYAYNYSLPLINKG